MARLDDALALWRGPFLAGTADDSLRWRLAGGLEDARLRAYELRARGLLDLGRHQEAISFVSPLLEQHPEQENLAAILMLAYLAAGRRTRSLAVYARLRRAIIDGYGIEPGANVQTVHRQILADDRPPPGHDSHRSPSPAFRTPSVGHFTGQTELLERLDPLLHSAGPRVAVIHGPAGIGKTALAVEWTHRNQRHFDAAIHLVLDIDRPAPGAEVRRRVLSALGVDGMTADPDEDAVILHESIAGRRLLILIDNVTSSDQLTGVVPAGDGPVLVVTSRQPLAALGTRFAVTAIGVPPLADGPARELLLRASGRTRLAPDGGVTSIVGHCGGLPLAIRLAAARLASADDLTVEDLAAELTDANRRLDALSVEDGLRTMRAVFDNVTNALSWPARGALGVLGIHRAHGLTVSLVAATLDISPVDAEAALRELAAAHLLEHRPDDRYVGHDLTCAYAWEDGTGPEPAERLVSWFLHAFAAANAVLSPAHRAVTVPVSADTPFDANPEAVMAYLDEEVEDLPALIQAAARHGHCREAWQMAYLLAGYFDKARHVTAAVDTYTAALAAALRTADSAAERITRATLAVMLNIARRPEEAIAQHERTIDLAVRSGLPRSIANAYGNMGRALALVGRYDEAKDAYLLALRHYEEGADERSHAITLNNLAVTLIHAGDLTEAGLLLDRAEDYLRRPEAGPGLRLVLNSRGRLLHLQGRHEEAVAAFARSLELCRTDGDRANEFNVLLGLADAYEAIGDRPRAATAAEEARMVGAAIGSVRHQWQAEVRSRTLAS